MDEQQTPPDRRSAIVAIILIAVGAIFLIGELFNVRFGSGFWPLLILVPGVLILASAFGGGDRRINAGTAVAGAVLTTLGLILWYQNASGNWESWAYIWALLPLAAGVTQMIVGARNDDEALAAAGRNTARVFAIVFVVGVVFFELIIFDRGGFGGYLLPIALIVAGGIILWMHYNRGGTMPWGDMFSRPEPPASTGPASPPPAPAGPTVPPPPAAAPPRTSATPPQPAAAVPPPTATGEHFPEDELPHPPPSDDAPFPVDEESPDAAPAAEAKAKPRRTATRKTTTRKSAAASTPAPSPDSTSGSPPANAGDGSSNGSSGS